MILKTPKERVVEADVTAFGAAALGFSWHDRKLFLCISTFEGNHLAMEIPDLKLVGGLRHMCDRLEQELSTLGLETADELRQRLSQQKGSAPEAPQV